MRRGARAVLAGLLLLLAACGGAAATGPGPTTGGPPPPPAWESDPTRLFHAETYLIARVDLAAARRSPQWDAIAPLLLRAFGDSSDSMLRALATKADVVLVGVAPPASTAPEADHDERIVMVIDGADLDRDLREEMAREHARPTTLAGREVLVGDDVAAVKLDARRWVVVNARDVGTVLAATSGAGEGASDARLRAVAERMGFGQGTFVIASKQSEMLTEQVRSLPFQSLAGIADAEYVGARVDLAGGVRVTATAEMRSPEAAAALAQAVSGELDAQSHGMIAMMLGVGPILARARVLATGSRADGETTMTAEELASLLGRVSAASSMMGGGP